MRPDQTVLLAAQVVLAAWLLWLAFKPYRVSSNRFLFMAFGFLLYRFVELGLIEPFEKTTAAFISANEALGHSVEASVLVETALRQATCLGVVLAIAFGLTWWLQRVLSGTSEGFGSWHKRQRIE